MNFSLNQLRVAGKKIFINAVISWVSILKVELSVGVDMTDDKLNMRIAKLT